MNLERSRHAVAPHKDVMPQMKLVGAMLVRNEAGRFLERVLEQMRLVCDEIVVLDDASEDDTAEICKKYGARVFQSPTSLFGINELVLRKTLWDYATQLAGHGGWILNLDADETLSRPEQLRDKIELAERNGADALGFRLYDMWDEKHYRDDAYWTAHRRFWPLCVRYDATRNYVWHEQPLHCGRFPKNAVSRMADAGLDVLHWGWSRESDRLAKYKRYKEIDKGGYGIAAQYESILDPNPALRLYGAKRVLIGGPVRQDETAFRLYLDALAKLDTTGLEVDHAFILHNSPGLEPIIRGMFPRAIVEHYTDDSEFPRGRERVWDLQTLGALIHMRNAILRAAHGYDYVFMVDSDLLLHPSTLQYLVAADKPIVAEVFWTRWIPESPELPNAWTADDFHFSESDLENWRMPGLYRVGMAGGCLLVRSDVIASGVTYTPIPNISWTIRDDRAFCIRAACAGFEVWLDTHCPARHLYSEEDVRKAMATM